MTAGNKTPLSPFERQLIAVVSTANFGTFNRCKAFIEDLRSERVMGMPLLTARGRWYLAFIAHRFRRQYTLTPEQWAWINEKLDIRQEHLELR